MGILPPVNIARALSCSPRAPLSLSVSVLLTVALWGCGDPAEKPSGPPVRPATAASGSELDDKFREQLAQLGYAEFSEQTAGAESGVVLYDIPAASPGYNLYSVISHSLSVLMDNDGREIHSWKVDDAYWTARCELLANGDVLIVGSDRDGDELSGHLLRMNWDGEVLWRRDVMAHHDVELTPEGHVLVLTSVDIALPELDPERPCQDNLLSLFTVDGEALGALSLHELVTEQPEALTLKKPKQGLNRAFQDYFHANAARWMPFEDLVGSDPLYGRDNILVTLRHQDVVAVIDWKKQRIVWTWGRGQLALPHEASWLPNGNMLIFDNGNTRRPWSRIIELDPRTGKIEWEYHAADRGDFYSPGRGTAQRLPNGNTLVSYSSAGEAFEVDQSGRQVWRFLSPYLSHTGARLALRMKRYDTAMVETVLEEQAALER